MLHALEVYVHHVALVAFAPDLQPPSGPADLELCPFPWRGIGGKFIQAQRAVHEGGDLLAVGNGSRSHLAHAIPSMSGQHDRVMGAKLDQFQH